MERFVEMNLTCTLQPKMRNEMRDMRTKKRKIVQSDFLYQMRKHAYKKTILS